MIFGLITNSLLVINKRVAFNIVYRRVLKLPPRSSASAMYTNNNIDSIERNVHLDLLIDYNKVRIS